MNVVISLGGSLIHPDSLDVNYIKKFRNVILRHASRFGNIGIVVGGGKLARDVQDAGKKFNLPHADLDMLGIMATRVNAELVRAAFGSQAHTEVVYNPTKKISTNKKVVVGAGYTPGYSTDRVAVLLARTLKAKHVINLTNVDYVYDKDPRKYKATPLKEMTWREFRKRFGSTWEPGKHTPFDPVAARNAARFAMEALIVNGKKLKNVENVLLGKKFIGSVIK